MARKMKDSGIEWIGIIPENWKIGRIGQLYSERREKVSDVDYPPLSVTMRGILPQLSTAAKTDAHDDRKLVRKGDFAINSRSDRRGSCGISPYDGSVSLINTILTPREEMHPVYYDWLFHSTMFSDEFYKCGHGIVNDLWTTNWQDMKKISVPIPSYTEQGRIAAFLDTECASVDAVIEQTRASIEEYKKLKQAVITQAITKGIRPNRKMKDSGIEWIGEIPKDWNVCKIKHIFKVVSGATPKSEVSDYWDGDIIWITPADYKTQDRYVSQGRRNLTEAGYASCGTSIIPAGSIVFSKRAPVGTVAINTNDLCTNQGCLSCVAKDHSTVNATFYYYAMSIYTEQFELLSTGTTFKEIAADVFSNFHLPYSPILEQNEIVEYLNEKTTQIDALILSKKKLLADIETYKKSLIFEYVTGKKEVV